MASRRWISAGRRRAGVRQVVVDLPPHAFDLLMDRGGKLDLPGGGGALCLLIQECERRLQAVRKVAGLAERAPHALFAIAQQRIEVTDERLHFRREISRHHAVPALVNVGEPLAQFAKRRHPVLDDASTGDHEDDRHDQCQHHAHRARGAGRPEDGQDQQRQGHRPLARPTRRSPCARGHPSSPGVGT